MMHVDVNLAVVVMPAPSCGVGDWSGVGVPGPVGVYQSCRCSCMHVHGCRAPVWGVVVWVCLVAGSNVLMVSVIVVSLLFDPVVFVGMSGFRAGIS